MLTTGVGGRRRGGGRPGRGGLDPRSVGRRQHELVDSASGTETGCRLAEDWVCPGVDSPSPRPFQLCTLGADINRRDPEGLTIVHRAACCNDIPILKYMMSLNADKDLLDSQGMS